MLLRFSARHESYTVKTGSWLQREEKLNVLSVQSWSIAKQVKCAVVSVSSPHSPVRQHNLVVLHLNYAYKLLMQTAAAWNNF